MPTPNPQAVEAAAQELYEDAMAETVDEGLAIPGADAEPEGVWDGEHKPIRELFRRQASKAVQAAEPRIRAQVFGELMEWCESKSEEIATFETLLAYAEAEGVALVAHHCRELAAKEEEESE